VWELTNERSNTGECTADTVSVKALVVGHMASAVAIDVQGVLRTGTYFGADEEARFT